MPACAGMTKGAVETPPTADLRRRGFDYYCERAFSKSRLERGFRGVFFIVDDRCEHLPRT